MKEAVRAGTRRLLSASGIQRRPIAHAADHLAARGPSLLDDDWQQELEFVQTMLEHYFRTPQEVARPPQLVTGRDVMSVLGLAPGPQVGPAPRSRAQSPGRGPGAHAGGGGGVLARAAPRLTRLK